MFRHHAAADSNVGVEGEGVKGHLGVGPAKKANIASEQGIATGGWTGRAAEWGTAELPNEVVRWAFTSVIRDWKMKGKEAFTVHLWAIERIRQTTSSDTFFLEHGRTSAVNDACTISAPFKV